MSQVQQPPERISLQPEKSLGKEIYDDSSSFGLLLSYYSAWLGTLIGIGLFIFSLYCAFHKTVRTSSVQGTVSNRPTCTYNKPDYSCYNIQIKYKINDENTKTFQSVGKINYLLNDSVTLYYDPKNVTNIELTQDNCGENWVAFFISGILCILISWFIYSIVKKYKFAQTLVSANFALNLFRR